MLAARASAVRSASRLARNFASVVDTAGVKVAAVDNGEPTSAVTFLIKAGSRFETKPGVAHALKGFAFKSTGQRSALGTIREAELYGGVLSTSLTREHLAVTAEFLRGDEPFFVNVLSSFVTSAKFTRHEFSEYVAPVCQAESTALLSDPATHALELAHALAFRNGLGSSVFSSANSHLTIDDVKAYAASVFGAGNIAVLGTGINPATLQGLVEQSLGSLSAAATPASSPSKYFGGETRIDGHGAPETVFVGFGTTGASAPELAVLAAHLDPTPAIKWSQGLSPIAAGTPVGTSVKSVLLPYSDATLFGLLIQGETTEGVKAAGQAAVTALKAAGSLKGEDLKKAVSKAKFEAASAFDKRDGLISALGSTAFSGSPVTLDGALSGLDKVDASAVSKITSSLLKSKPTYVAIGNTASLPYADELGL
ncbi:Cytochrome b-c1 complex subunit 2, mitochondrial [Sparassis crispa]|uniref:Cytochrome b-c1 complex subunit 2, mitochondrial n=1 Tax=Sparassis crispa TaxID=139825 RepID=A0A401GXA4_9APHY|nr:Cytochrome b-c1 complex subunit 2, mitochondrial [Sparassis crispa]GBE86851.1 Cytochrome b-c1 complex subunit 2, mitochondrial [Sparassis crispa]